MPFDDFELRILECGQCKGALPAPPAGAPPPTCPYCGAPASTAREVGVFSYDIRVVVCEKCDAPLPVPIAGGHTTCAYCASTFEIVPRRRHRLGSDDPHDEAARIARLRAQDRGPIRMPPDIAVMMKQGGLISATIEQAQSLWKATRQRLRRQPTSELALRFYYLTELIADYHNWKKQRLVARSYLEAALEDLDDPRYVQPLYCWLSRNAFERGDPASARAWLEMCDPCPDELGMDSAYRFTVAWVSLRQGDYHAVLEALGEPSQAIPLNDKYEESAILFRAHAIEHLRGPDEAAAYLVAAIGAQDRRWSLILLMASGGKVELCPESLRMAVERRWTWPGTIAFVAVFAIGALFLLADAIAGPWLWDRRILGYIAIPIGFCWLLFVGTFSLAAAAVRWRLRHTVRNRGHSDQPS